jgi:hypothetical protein
MNPGGRRPVRVPAQVAFIKSRSMPYTKMASDPSHFSTTELGCSIVPAGIPLLDVIQQCNGHRWIAGGGVSSKRKKSYYTVQQRFFPDAANDDLAKPFATVISGLSAACSLHQRLLRPKLI